MINVIKHGQVREDVMYSNLMDNVPKLVSEGVLMAAVKKGGNRQELHEAIRQYTILGSYEFAEAVHADKRFGLTMEEILDLSTLSKLVGAAPTQVRDYLLHRED